MIHSNMGIHLHKGATAESSESGWVSLDTPDGAHCFTIFVHDPEAARSLIAALEAAIVAEDARRARYAV